MKAIQWERCFTNFGGVMKSIGIYVNLQKDADFDVTKTIIKIAEKMGACCEIASKNKKYDFIISLGGDGTFLSSSREFYDNKIVGINLGTLGFLSEIEKDNIESGLKNILDGKFYIEKRFLLETEVHDKKLSALNDIVISRGAVARLLNLEIYFNGKFVDNYVADGVIISTPTGSTAYSMSAGGPIIEPKLDVLLVTPICAHSLYHRPIIIDANTEVKIKTEVNNFMITADGQECVESENAKEIIVRRSLKFVDVIKTHENCFFDVVREKFMLN